MEQKDLELIKNVIVSVMGERLEKSEASMLKRMDERFEKSEATMLKLMDEKLEKSEASMLKLMDEKLEKSEASMLKLMDEKLKKSETSMLKRMDEKLAESENLILDELERTRNILEKQISRVQSDMDEMKQYYRITRLENSNASMLLKITEDLSRRVEVLERGTA